MPNPPLRIPWQFLDSLEPAGASEFGFGYGLTAPGYEDADPADGGRYQGKAASSALEYDQRESDHYGRETD